jgi:HlyD family secretion protein
MRKRLYILGGLLAIAAIAAYLLFRGSLSAAAPKYEFAAVTRGNIETTVSATGTVSPVTTVEVGTQVSGIIDSVYVDYNDRVREGQVLAVLDTTLLRSSVLDAEASVERVDAQMLQAQVSYDRYKRLYDSSMVSEEEYLPYEVNLKSQRASVKSAQVALDRARRNLQYAVIKSPISGIVINKNVEAGQTVASSLSTPTLFNIAEDLSRMEILADVGESDIGQIKVGQDVRFEVAAFMNKEFAGKVSQIRLQPRTVSNVVTYTVVCEANNEDGLLMPGMTATVSIVTEKHPDVLLVPSKALRFQPPDDVLAAYRAKQEQRWANRNDSTHAGGRNFPGPGQGTGDGQQGRPGGGFRNMSTVWFVDSLGQLSAAPFKSGLTDNSNTEVAGSRILTEGMKIVVGSVDATAKKTTTTTTTNRPGGFGGMRGF